MSGDMTTGQIVGSVAGAIIGGVIGNFPGAMQGMAIGGMIGGWIDPPPAPNPPPLGDVGINTYIRNAPVTLAYGQCKLHGGCLWLGDMGVQMDEGGSKKNPEYTPQMWMEFAIAHCEGPAIEFLKYWINEKTIGENIQDDQYFTIRSYLGTNSQTVDPSIDSFLSGSAAPAIPYIYTTYSYVYAFFDGGYFNNVPSFSAEVKAFLTESGEEDANPVRVLYHFLTDTRVGAAIDSAWFDGDPDTVDSSWKIAADYCDEIVSYVNEEGSTIQEPRFRYSNYLDTRAKGYDFVRDILMTCRGILTWCQGKIYIIIENDLEEVQGYFSDEHEETFTATGSSTVDRIYVSSAFTEPLGYWEGEVGKITLGGIEYEFTINTMGTDYVDLIDSLPSAPTNETFTIRKDNIKEGTFNFSKTSKLDIVKICRVEFINRNFKDLVSGNTNEYQWDVVEWESPDPYLEVENEDDKTQQIRCAGVKRRSQAIRLAKYYCDAGRGMRWFCEFSTDLVGYFYKVGDIIGISHSTTGWVRKEFRIISLEEIESDEIKINCMEYDRTIFDDEIPQQLYETSGYMIPSVYSSPAHVERLHVVQDETNNILYICFKRPENQNWFYGAMIYIKKGVSGEYNAEKVLSSVTSSVKLATGGIDDVQTSIPYDLSTIYGTFPDSGEFWIEDELISYTSINDTLDQFEGCTRGSNAASHADTEYCHNKRSNMYSYITFDASDVGSTWYIKAVSQNIVGIEADFDTAPEDSIIIS